MGNNANDYGAFVRRFKLTLRNHMTRSGLSAKQLARAIEIPHRTIESHMDMSSTVMPRMREMLVYKRYFGIGFWNDLYEAEGIAVSELSPPPRVEVMRVLATVSRFDSEVMERLADDGELTDDELPELIPLMDQAIDQLTSMRNGLRQGREKKGARA